MTNQAGPGAVCDVTGVTAGRDHVPLAARLPRADAGKLAAQYSEFPSWAAVLVKDTRTGQTLDTYAGGRLQPAPAGKEQPHG